MIYSMTGYANVTHEVPIVANSEAPATSVSVELRTVNSRFLDLTFRIPDELRATEPAMREMLTQKLGRGKVEIRINLQRSEVLPTIGALNHDALTQLALIEDQILSRFPKAERLKANEILHWPGVLSKNNSKTQTTDNLSATVIQCAQQALNELIHMRAREGAQLVTLLLDQVTEIEKIVTEITPWVPELISKHQQKIVERLQEALGLATAGNTPAPISREETAERIRQEMTMYGIRIDISEELSRLSTHLHETRRILQQGGRVGKQLDFMMQELNREANTLGSKAAAKELADSAMKFKLLIEQMREQIQNLE
ncbi:YicC/YloC family endoribonuclease [Mycoavidus sp. B2-EB]|uniref:YicC/YloC family endoribonuclease n=1 Tax=Mycoavidus sp. B2-EB TaxID=2651972 RepID=UPI0016256B63|nr:YicC/YloC family endoribonuclease [Mycoavidus sp. B2-EB]BBO59294.1 hypothetical protein MPB2EB_0409 [Mycoavidus sp. B2-EB]